MIAVMNVDGDVLGQTDETDRFDPPVELEPGEYVLVRWTERDEPGMANAYDCVPTPLTVHETVTLTAIEVTEVTE